MVEHIEENIGDDDFPIFTTNLNHLIDRGYPRGYADALDAAREAVANTPMRMGAYNTKAADLAAIDALREGDHL